MGLIKKFESYSKEDYIKSKIKQTYVNKSAKNKEVVNSLQTKLEFEPIVNIKKEIEELENEYHLYNSDGSRKRYLQKNYSTTSSICSDISKKLKERGFPYLAKITTIKCEKSDNRNYQTIIIYKPIDNSK